MTRSLILASASPRRRQLLEQLGLVFIVAEQNMDESRRAGESAHDYVLRMASEKAGAGLATCADGAIVIGADTSVVCDGDVLGKPEDAADGWRMLQRLSGREHEVMSAVTVAQGARQQSRLSTSRVTFRPISAVEAQAYWETGEPSGKAGGYAIQGLGAIFIQHLQGSYSGVMGLPLFETAALLQEFGIPCLAVPAEA